MAVNKTWANAWNTSSRMREDQDFPCISGREDGQDELKHYLCCEPLWTAVIFTGLSHGQALLVLPLRGIAADDCCCFFELPCHQDEPQG